MRRTRLLTESLLLAVAIATSLAGCASPAHTRSALPHRAQPLADVITMGNGLYKYMEVMGRAPASEKDLERFCADRRLPCGTLDWSRFSWGTIDGNDVTVNYSSGSSSASIVIGRDSVSVIDTSARRDDELKEQLEKLMKDPKDQP